MEQHVTRVGEWRAARQFPETYPGDRPAGAYLLLDELVFPLRFEDGQDWGSGTVTDLDGVPRPVDDLLRERGFPVLLDRYASLAYGANRNPGSLRLKFLHYQYRSPGSGLAVPVLRGSLRGADVVAGGLSSQGYLYGDLLIGSPLTRDTTVEAWLALLDEEQLRVLNDSEGITGGPYVAARFPGFRLAGSDRELAPLGYAGTQPVFVSPRLMAPISFATVQATNRTLPAMTPREMLAHVLDAFELPVTISRMCGLDPEDAATELMKYLNGQWWYGFNTGDHPLRAYGQVVALLNEQLRAHAAPVSTAALQGQHGLVLPTEAAYHPGRELTLRGMLG